jgi:hypothetical protein
MAATPIGVSQKGAAMLDNVILPSYYVIKRKPSDEELEEAQRALCITPCSIAIVSTYDQADYRLAQQLSQDVVWASSEMNAELTALRLSKEFGHPVLIVGNAELLDAVYEDGVKEKVC